MKKISRRIVAIVASLAMIVTGISFVAPATDVVATTNWISPASGRIPATDAGAITRYTLGVNDDSDGLGRWDFRSANNQWKNYTYQYQNADDIEGFTVNSQTYNNRGGFEVWSDDFTSDFNLTPGGAYEVSIVIGYTPTQNTSTGQHVQNCKLTFEGSQNLVLEGDLNGPTLNQKATTTYTGTYVAGSTNSLNMLVSGPTPNYYISEKGYYSIESITFTPTGETWTSLANDTHTRIKDEDNHNTPWELYACDDGPDLGPTTGRWGQMSYRLDDNYNYDDLGSVVMKCDQCSGWIEAYALTATAKGYLSTATDTDGNALEAGRHYTAEIDVWTDKDINSDTAGASGNEKRRLGVNINGRGMEEYAVLADGDTIEIPEFVYQSSDSQDIEFFLDELEAVQKIQFTDIRFTCTDSDWTVVPNSTPTTPTGSPWTFEATWDPGSEMYGQMQYKTTGSASDMGNTSIRTTKVSGWQNYASLAKLESYLASFNPVAGMEYQLSINYDISGLTTPTGTDLPRAMHMFYDGNSDEISVSNGTNQTYTTATFEWEDIYPASGILDTNVIFDLGQLNADAIVNINSVTLTPTSNWIRVPDNDPDFQIGDFYIFAGDWGGEGRIMYYQTGTPASPSNMQIKMGSGNRTDYSEQIKINNADAYANLTQDQDYYMVYTFTSDRAGTVKFAQQGYEDAYTVNVVAGQNRIVKRFTYDAAKNTYYDEHGTEQPFNVYMEPNGMAEGAVLSNFDITFTDTVDGWTLIPDSKDEYHQYWTDITDTPDILQFHTNVYYGGLASFDADYNEDGEDAIAQTAVKLDQGGATFNNQWQASYRIPNDVFYDKTDTNGEELVSGKDYTLRLFINSTRSSANGKGIVLVQQGYNQEQWTRYTGIDAGLNMLNGTVTPLNSTSHTDYDKEGGIDFTYDATQTVDDEYVMIDVSELPTGTVLTDLSWEFYAPEPETTTTAETTTTPEPTTTTPEPTTTTEVPTTTTPTPVEKYKITIDDVEVATVDAGDDYTFPTNGVAGYEDVKVFINTADNSDYYAPGGTVTNIQEDLDYYSVAEAYSITSPGASVHMDLASTGIAWQAEVMTIDKDGFENTESVMDSPAFEFGMLMTTEDLYNTFYAPTAGVYNGLTLDTYYAIGGDGSQTPGAIKKVVNPTGKWGTAALGTYRCGLMDIDQAAFVRNFVCVPFAQIKVNGQAVSTEYGDMTAPRSLKYVGQRVQADSSAYSKLNETEKAAIDAYAAAE